MQRNILLLNPTKLDPQKRLMFAKLELLLTTVSKRLGFKTADPHRYCDLPMHIDTYVVVDLDKKVMSLISDKEYQVVVDMGAKVLSQPDDLKQLSDGLVDSTNGNMPVLLDILNELRPSGAPEVHVVHLGPRTLEDGGNVEVPKPNRLH